MDGWIFISTDEKCDNQAYMKNKLYVCAYASGPMSESSEDYSCDDSTVLCNAIGRCKGNSAMCVVMRAEIMRC